MLSFNSKIDIFLKSLLVMILNLSLSFSSDMPPGCLKSPNTFGGCMGKAQIEFIQMTPPQDCLQLSANNCNGGVLNIVNLCHQTLKISEIELLDKGSSLQYSVEFYKINGIVKARFSEGNYARFNPISDEIMSIEAKLGNLPLILKYKKSKNLCP